MIEKHYRESLRSFLRLHKKTPRCVIYLLAGSLPGSALLHLRQFSLFGMISRKADGILYQHAKNVFNFATSIRVSWFHQIRELSLLYDLPHPLDMLEHPMGKTEFKRLVKSKILSYWEIVLREEAFHLKSLCYFQPQFMSLSKPHPLWSFTKEGLDGFDSGDNAIRTVP